MRKKIILSILLSFLITLAVTNVFFFKGVPKINPVKIKRTAEDLRDEAIILKNTLGYKLSAKKIDYKQSFGDANMTFDFQEAELTPTPTMVLLPMGSTSPSPTVEPTLIPSPTSYPTVTPAVSVTQVQATPTPAPTKKPTRAPKSTPTPLPTDKPPAGVALIDNPLDQPYYNPSLAYKCYNPDKFIEVYGGGTAGACYASAKSYVDKNLTMVSILGKSITVHKKAAPYFQAVANKLKDFKSYKINTIGAYVFRCNVNASTSDRFDLCSSGCVPSAHAFGIAVDINWDTNCNGCSNFDMPREIIDAFESYGFRWGGRYKSIFGSTIDPMHFELMVDLCRDIK